jgi:hypothetical protein
LARRGEVPYFLQDHPPLISNLVDIVGSTRNFQPGPFESPC